MPSTKRESDATIIMREDLEKRWPGRVYEEYRFMTTRKYRFDFAVLGPKIRLAFEIEGGVYTRKAHGSITGILRDLEKYNLAGVSEFRVFRFTPRQIECGEHIQILSRLPV